MPKTNFVDDFEYLLLVKFVEVNGAVTEEIHNVSASWRPELPSVSVDCHCSPSLLFQCKPICTFNQHCLSYRISNRPQFKSSMFSKNSLKLYVALTHLFPRCASRSKDVLSTNPPIHMSSVGRNRGQVSHSL